jgi:hypothetical protein
VAGTVGTLTVGMVTLTLKVPGPVRATATFEV